MAMVIQALQGRRGSCHDARPPLNIRCTDTVPRRTCDVSNLRSCAFTRASKHTVYFDLYMNWLVIDFRAIPTFSPRLQCRQTRRQIKVMHPFVA